MPDTSAILGLPYLMPSQAQKHVTHNEALRLLDILVQMRVAGFGTETPPAAPAEGEIHALGAAPAGAWAGQAGTLAVWLGGAWSFIAPQTGWRAADAASGELRVWDGAGWTAPAASPSGLATLGVNTAADTANRLAVASEAVLFSHDGAGHQIKVNKAAPGDTASLLFQSGWTGHAEMGLAGDTNFAIKVSGDGSAWSEALSIAAGTGFVGVNTPAPAVALQVTGQAAIGDSYTATSAQVAVRHAGDATSLLLDNNSAGLSATMLSLDAARPANAAYKFLQCYSGSFGDLEFRLSGDGNATCDGAWSGGGADYAEWFEWADGNPADEDRRGLSVVLEGGRIRPAAPGEEPVGVISGNPSVVGDSDIGRWKGKYLRDDFGSYLRDAGGARRLAPGYDPAQPYVPRAERREWAIAGLMGKLRLRKGQPAGARWIRMRAVSGEVEEWLVR